MFGYEPYIRDGSMGYIYLYCVKQDCKLGVDSMLLHLLVLDK